MIVRIRTVAVEDSCNRGYREAVSKAPKPAKPAEQKPSEYDRFEELTRKLVKVPKTEIDAERAKQNGKKPGA